MGATQSLRESIFIKGPASLVLGLGVIVVCAALLVMSTVSLLVGVPATYLKRWWSRWVAARK